MDINRLESMLTQILQSNSEIVEGYKQLEKRMDDLEKTSSSPAVSVKVLAPLGGPIKDEVDAKSDHQDKVQDQDADWLKQSSTPFAPPRTSIGDRTIRRQSSLFAPANEVQTAEIPASSALHVSVPRYLIDPEIMLKKATVPGILYLMDIHEDYIKRQPEAKISSFKKNMAEFCSADVLKDIYAKEKSLATSLSLTLNRYQDLITTPDAHFLAACGRLLRPKSQSDFFSVLRKVTDKYSLPKVSSWKIGETDYAFKIEGYEGLMFKEMDRLIRMTFDAINFIYEEATIADLRRLPGIGWGTTKSPDALRLAMSCFEPYTNSLIKALGGQPYLDTNAKLPPELRDLLNLWNQKQVSLARNLQDQDAELLPVQSVKELEKQYMLDLERKKMDARKKEDTRRAHVIVGEQEQWSPFDSPLQMAAEFEYSQVYPEDETLDASNLMYATPYFPQATKPSAESGYSRECTCTNVCHNIFYRNKCDAGKDCIYAHGAEAIALEVETYLRKLVASPSVGERMIHEVLAKIKNSPGPPLVAKPAIGSSGNSPVPVRTPLAPGRSGGRGGGQLYNPGGRGGGGRGNGGRGDLRALDALESSGVDASVEGPLASEVPDHQA